MQEGGLPPLLSLLGGHAALQRRVSELQGHVESLEGRLRAAEGRGPCLSFDNVHEAARAIRKRAREDPGYHAHIEQHYPGAVEDPVFNMPMVYLLEHGFMQRGYEIKLMQDAVETAEKARRETDDGFEFEIRKKQAVIEDAHKQRAELCLEMSRMKAELERTQNDVQRLRKERDALYADKKSLTAELRDSGDQHATDVQGKLRKIQRDTFSVLRKHDVSPDELLYRDLEKIFA
jgi:hypothetical protein